MRLDAILRAHEFMKVERPPQLWEADTEDVDFIPLLGEMIVAALRPGTEPADLTLNASNVVVEEDEDTEGAPRAGPGEYVAVTVSGPGDWSSDRSWIPTSESAPPAFRSLGPALLRARARWVYGRALPPASSLTVFFSRLLR